jgi:DNA-binding beta-propeller fold protein YncE
VWLLVGGPLARGDNDAPFAPVARESTSQRQPVALALVDDERTLLVANCRSGSVSVVDLASGSVAGEYRVGERLSEMQVIPGFDYVLLTDEGRHELVLLEFNMDETPQLAVLERLPVSEYPVSLHVAPDGLWCTVASLWSRMLTMIELHTEGESGGPLLRVVHEIELPFAPREQLLLPGGPGYEKLLVADSFGGQTAVVDMDAGTVDCVREIPGHNIRGLALGGNGQYVHVAQSISDPLARADAADIRWGITVSSSVQTLKVSSLLRPEADVLDGSWVVQLGDFGNGVADPADLAVLAGGRLVVAASGVEMIAAVNPHSGTEKLLAVGDHPAALLITSDPSRIYVAHQFDDSLAVVDTERMEVVQKISLGPSPELTSADRGRRLFYDARLSLDGWFSCHSCHTDGHSNGLLADTLGDGGYGDPKRVLSLLGVGQTGPWAWTGTMARLEEQIDKSVSTSMHGSPLTAEQIADIAAFLNSLAPPPVVSPRGADEAAVERGSALFVELRCGRCHAPPAYTSDAVYDVALVDESGRRRFNPPSLRGVSQQARLFHDGRAESLEAVLSQTRHQLDRELTPHELADLVQFLRSL